MTFAAYEQSNYSSTPERLFQFIMGSGTQWLYNDSTLEENYLGETFVPAVIEMGDISQALAEPSPTVTIEIESSADVCDQFIPYQPIEPMRVRVYRRHYDDPDSEYVIEMIGRVTTASFDENTRMCTMSVQMSGSYLKRKTPWTVYQKQCNYALFGPGCQVNRLAFQVLASVTAVSLNSILSNDFAAHPDDWFTNGYAVSPSGETRFIIAHVGNEIIVQTPFLNLAGTNILETYPGCDLLRSTCFTKFNNLDRFLGFPWVPLKNPYTDSVFGNAGNSSSKSKTDWRKAINPAGWNGSWGLF